MKVIFLDIDGVVATAKTYNQAPVSPPTRPNRPPPSSPEADDPRHPLYPVYTFLQLLCVLMVLAAAINQEPACAPSSSSQHSSL